MTESPLWKLMDEVHADLVQRRSTLKSSDFQSLYVDYEPPYVERLWYQLDPSHRVFLHHIPSCRPSEALWHPHPWPSIVRVLDTRQYSDGYYEHGVGYDSKREGDPPTGVVQRIRGEITYVMDDPHAWHYVAPSDIVFSIMIVGAPFPQEQLSPGYRRPTKKLGPLSDARVEQLLRGWETVLSWGQK